MCLPTTSWRSTPAGMTRSWPKSFKASSTIDFNVDLTGFSIAEVDSLVEGLHPEEPGDPGDDVLPDLATVTPRCRAWRHLATRTAPADLRLSARSPTSSPL